MAERRSNLPHLLLRLDVPPSPFVSPRSIVITNPPERNRAIHAALLEEKLLETERGIRRRIAIQEASGRPAAGTYVEFSGEPGYSLKLKSLDARSRGLEVVAVREELVRVAEEEQILERATVFVPHGKLAYFIEKTREYASENIRPRRASAQPKPKNEALIASISAVQLAVLDSLWTDDADLLPASGCATWWEVWLRGEGGIVRDTFEAAVQGFGIEVRQTILTFPERTVVLARATREQMATSVEALDQIGELRLAKETALEFLGLPKAEQGEWAREFRARVSPPAVGAPVICILDTGVNRGHPLLASALSDEDCQAVDPSWGKDDHSGHGTQMAGLALYGDLAEALQQTTPVLLFHRLESVKILPRTGLNPPDLYGAITAEAIARAEVQAPQRRRAFCMAVTTTDSRDRGRPSSWSAELDKLASGSDDGQRRLILVSAGNTDVASRHNYPSSNVTDEIHDPGQSWNALTIGGYTNKVTIKEDDCRRGWRPLARAGALSPTSSTACVWATEWANKPDIVTEGGNLGVDPFSGKAFMMDSLSLLTTSAHFAPPRAEPFTAMCETSAAVAQAARLACIIHGQYPRFWPETIRALLVHSAEWTPAMRELGLTTMAQKLTVLRSCGHGVPSLSRALWSASDALTLIVEDEFQPFDRSRMKEFKVYELPWPTKELQQLEHTLVELRVTLSYFVEPNPARRGWRDRYRYQSHALRYEVIRPAEGETSFRRRVNQAEREDREDRSRDRDSDGWVLGPRIREHGSIHSDTWTGTAADLARRNLVAVFPVVGWWREQLKLGRSDRKARFSLIVSVRTPRTDIDIYTPVETLVRVPILLPVST